MEKTWEYTNAVQASSLYHSDRHILQTLATHCNQGNKFTWAVTLQNLASETGLDKSTVYRRMPELISSGWLAKIPGSGQRANKYQLTLPAATETAEQPPSRHVTRRRSPEALTEAPGASEPDPDDDAAWDRLIKEKIQAEYDKNRPAREALKSDRSN